MAHIDPIISKKKTDELARELWEKAGRPAGAEAAYHAEAERRLKESSLRANNDITDENGVEKLSRENISAAMPPTSTSKQPISPT